MLQDVRTVVVAVVSLGIALVATGHVVLHKRDVRAALGWVGFIWFAPVIGASAYFVFGVNRIRRRAQALRLPEVRARIPESLRPPPRRSRPRRSTCARWSPSPTARCADRSSPGTR